MKLENFIKTNKSDMLNDLINVVKNEKVWLKDNIHDCGEIPSIDIRLCIDLEDDGESGTWIFRTGLSRYDQKHSKYCAASIIDFDTNAMSLLTDLINQIED
jgi:hypothetical protein